MTRTYGSKKLPRSALAYTLEALIPYTNANLKLAFKPNAFFNELERIDRQKAWQKANSTRLRPYKRDRLRTAFYRCKKRGLIEFGQDGVPRLTSKGRQFVTPYKPKLLGDKAHLLVIFDIPELDRTKRRELRLLLKELKFMKVQQSVWATKYDHRELIKAQIAALELDQHVQVYESLRLI